MMNNMQILIKGLLAGAVILVVGMLLSPAFQALAPGLKAEYQNPDLFRPWSDPIMSLYFVHPFLLGIILAWIWNKVSAVVVAKSELQRGLIFGAAVWAMSSLPGMLITYASFPLSVMMVTNWCISGLVEMLCVGVFFSKTIK